MFIGGIPHVHAYLILESWVSIRGILARERRMFVVTVAIVVAVPACLHSDLICIVNLEIQIVDWSIHPDVRDVTVRPLFEDVLVVNICTKSVISSTKRIPVHLQKRCHVLTPSVEYATADSGVLFFASTATISDTDPPSQFPLELSWIHRISPV